MDAVFYYEIPNLHPLAVHFPLALLLTAAFTALVWAFRGTKFWRGATMLLLVFGSAGAAAAYFTGDAMREQSEGVPIVEDLVGLHEEMGLYTLLASCAATLAVIGIAAFAGRSEVRSDGSRSTGPAFHGSGWTRRASDASRPTDSGADSWKAADPGLRDPLLLRVMATCLVLIAAALVAWTAHIGATMTWGVVVP